MTASAPEREIRDILIERPGLMLATAESCTGGSIARRIVTVDGSSAYFNGGIVAYANEVKHRLLGVPADILEDPGAVSEECAHAMVEGARRALGAQVAVSSTGIAGPTGGTARKPVGLVYLGIAGPLGTWVERHQFPGSRLEVIEAATQRALELLRDAVRHTE